ncbi:MAG: arginine deiminase-related protein [Woeseiaceae bacterium]|nr:arginine deiminase-related protein [Woeseiaceae bacterium]
MAQQIESQITNAAFMIRPVRFRSNPETADSNRFQDPPDIPAARQQERAAAEFEGLLAALRGAGIEVFVFDDTPEPHTPDALFPNNWVSFHADGRVVIYPMEAENRRAERRSDIVDALYEQGRFDVREVIDLTPHEQNGHFLEGTGSLVLDRVNHVAYACLSTRTHLEPLGDFAQRLDYEIVAFDAVDRGGVPIYHTNVMMSVGEELAFVCAESIRNAKQREAVLGQLKETGHEVVELGYQQLEAFAGNMLELKRKDGGRVLAMSTQARAALDAQQLERAVSNGDVVTAPIDTIEASGGGSVRCMLAEIHLPRRG